MASATVDSPIYNILTLQKDSIEDLYEQRLDQPLDENTLILSAKTLYKHILEALKTAVLETLEIYDKNRKKNLTAGMTS